MKKWLVLIGGIIFMTSSITSAAPKKYGYVPPTFPRDPAEVNQFAEHIVLGQILEPMVDTDKLGNVTPGLAESWTFEDKGLTIRFKIRKDRTFSNGQKLESKDIKYTIERVIAKKSQSSNFIASISSVEVPSSDVLILKLKEPNVSILKALSRDQLGVVPVGWNFDKNSNEPIIGSGPYRLLKRGDKWNLEVNEKYPQSSSIKIKEWQLVFFADGDLNVPAQGLPDYVPGATLSTKTGMQKVGGFEKLKAINQISYAQTSAWWHPHGVHFNSPEIRNRAMGLIESVLDKGCKKLDLERATGVIPKGVAGHMTVTHAPEVHQKKFQKSEPLRLAFVGATFDDFLKANDVQAKAKEYGFQIEIVKISPSEMGKVAEKKPDVIFAGWAGGFNDPEGFIALLPTFLGKDFSTYIGPAMAEKYKRARQEENWTVRSELFQQINEHLRKDQFMVPGWRIPFFIIGKPNMISEEATYRYTPRLHAVKEM